MKIADLSTLFILQIVAPKLSTACLGNNRVLLSLDRTQNWSCEFVDKPSTDHRPWSKWTARLAKMYWELSFDDPDFFATIDTDEEILIYFYNPVESLLQVGPTCGLVCLVQAKRFIQPNSEPFAVDMLLEEARRRGLSNNGEMFSGLTLSIL